MPNSDHGITLDDRNQEQPKDKKRAHDSSSRNIPGSDKQTRQTDDRAPRQSEDDIQREQLGPRGVPGKPAPAKMTPQREKKTPKDVDPGHTK